MKPWDGCGITHWTVHIMEDTPRYMNGHTEGRPSFQKVLQQIVVVKASNGFKIITFADGEVDQEILISHAASTLAEISALLRQLK